MGHKIMDTQIFSEALQQWSDLIMGNKIMDAHCFLSLNIKQKNTDKVSFYAVTLVTCVTLGNKIYTLGNIVVLLGHIWLMTPPDTFYFSCVCYYTKIGMEFLHGEKRYSCLLWCAFRVVFQNGSFSIFYFNSTDVAACVPVRNLSMKF